jgi:hypothetical protein
MNNINVKKRFPWSDRIASSLCGCFSKNTPIYEIKNKMPLFTFNEAFGRDTMQNSTLEIKINSTGSLELDPNVMHPFVRVHIVDLETSKYLQKKNSHEPGVFNRETAGYFNSEQEHGDISMSKLLNH